MCLNKDYSQALPKVYRKIHIPSPGRHRAQVFSSAQAERSDRISPTGSSGPHKYRPEDKHVIGERATGKARQSVCDVAAENKSHFPSPTRR